MARLELDPAVLARLAEEAAGAGATVVCVERIGEFSVARIAVRQKDDSPVTLIAKSLRVLPSGLRGEQSRILNEYTALEFVGGVDQTLAPRLLAADATRGVVLLEDLAPLRPLNELLVEGDNRGHEGLRLFATRMARLHALTKNGYDEYYQRRVELGPTDTSRDARLVLGEWDWTLPDLADCGFRASASAQDEIREAEQLLCEPGPFKAFSNGDPGLHNFMTDGTSGRIIDWEDACFRHVLHDASCLWVPNSVWMTIADPVELGLDAIYRDALSEAIPQAKTAAYDEALAAACIARAADRFMRFRLLDGRPPGHESRAQIIFTLEAAARSADHLKAFPHLSAWAHDVAAFLRARWPDADCEFPNAYTSRAAWAAR